MICISLTTSARLDFKNSASSFLSAADLPIAKAVASAKPSPMPDRLVALPIFLASVESIKACFLCFFVLQKVESKQ